MTDAVPVPPLAELLASARVVALPLVTRFRGVEVREAVLFEGPEGWTEFSPFAEYGDAEAATWLAAAIDFGWAPQPAAAAIRDPRQRDGAGGGRGIRPRDPGALRRMPDRQGQGRRARADASPTTSRACAPSARRWARRGACASTRTAHGTSTRPSTPCTRSPSSTSSTSSSRARASRSSASCGAASSTWACRSPPTRACGRRRTRSPSRAPAPPTCSSSRRSRSAACAARSRSSPRRGCPPSSRAPSTPQSGSRWASRSRRRSPSSTTTAGWARRRSSRPTSRARRSRRAEACCRSVA